MQISNVKSGDTCSYGEVKLKGKIIPVTGSGGP
jgi:hypothetical protein